MFVREIEEHEKGYGCLERRDAMVSKPGRAQDYTTMCLRFAPGAVRKEALPFAHKVENSLQKEMILDRAKQPSSRLSLQLRCAPKSFVPLNVYKIFISHRLY